MADANPTQPKPPVHPAPAPVVPIPSTRTESHSALKEWATALIGCGIVAVTLVMAVMLFLDRANEPRWTTGQPQNVTAERFDPFTRGKDVLLLLLPLTGAIVGYYTGRVIADRTVQQANATTQQATATAQQANAAAQTHRAVARQMGERALAAVELARSPAGSRAALTDEEGPGAESSRLRQAEREIRELMEIVRA